MTDVEWADMARAYCGGVALLLVVLFVRLAIQRTLRYGWHRGVNPHPLTSLSLAVLFVMSALRRKDGVGEPGDIFLWSACVYLTTLAIGMLLAVTWRWPWKRDREWESSRTR